MLYITVMRSVKAFVGEHSAAESFVYASMVCFVAVFIDPETFKSPFVKKR